MSDTKAGAESCCEASTEYGPLRWLSGKESSSLQEPQEMCVGTLDWKVVLEKEMATRSSILAWENPWTGGFGWLQSMELQKSQT